MKHRRTIAALSLLTALCLLFSGCGEDTKEPAVAETDTAVPADAAETEPPETETPETEPPQAEEPAPETESAETATPETEPPETEDAETKESETETSAPEETETEGASDETEAETEEETGEEPEEPRVYNYLNGKTCTPEEQNHRPVAIMLNNYRIQLPQYGLDAGQIYFECVTEGSIPRMMMLVDDYENLGTVGSIRSSRDYFATWVNDYDAIYVHAGGSPQAYNTIAALGLSSLDGANMYLPSTYFRDQWRLANIGYEHSLMTNGAGIAAGIRYKGYRTELKNDYTPLFSFYDEEDDHKFGGSPAPHVRMYSTPLQTVDYVYDEESGEYLRWQYNGVAHVDGSTSNQISVKNVIILFTDITPIPGDTAGRVAVTKVGSGQGYYITNGQRKGIEWSRETESAQMVLTYRNGDPLLLNAGKTFVNVVDNSVAKSVNFEFKW